MDKNDLDKLFDKRKFKFKTKFNLDKTLKTDKQYRQDILDQITEAYKCVDSLYNPKWPEQKRIELGAITDALLQAEDYIKNYDKKDFNKQVFNSNINKFIKEIRNIPPNWFKGEKSKLRMFVEYLSTDGLTILEDCKELIK